VLFFSKVFETVTSRSRILFLQVVRGETRAPAYAKTPAHTKTTGIPLSGQYDTPHPPNMSRPPTEGESALSSEAI